jgi:hypothetical protein
MFQSIDDDDDDDDDSNDDDTSTVLFQLESRLNALKDSR